MNFTEEEFDEGHRVSLNWGLCILIDSDFLQIVPLIKKGDKVKVTEGNKHSYLDELANYRLTQKGKKQTEYFSKGE